MANGWVRGSWIESLSTAEFSFDTTQLIRFNAEDRLLVKMLLSDKRDPSLEELLFEHKQKAAAGKRKWLKDCAEERERLRLQRQASQLSICADPHQVVLGMGYR